VPRGALDTRSPFWKNGIDTRSYTIGQLRFGIIGAVPTGRDGTMVRPSVTIRCTCRH
jgi:hypothetical protein